MVGYGQIPQWKSKEHLGIETNAFQKKFSWGSTVYSRSSGELIVYAYAKNLPWVILYMTLNHKSKFKYWSYISLDGKYERKFNE